MDTYTEFLEVNKEALKDLPPSPQVGVDSPETVLHVVWCVWGGEAMAIGGEWDRTTLIGGSEDDAMVRAN